MKTFFKYLLAFIIGALPSILFDIHIWNWQWWAIVVPMDILVIMVWGYLFENNP